MVCIAPAMEPQAKDRGGERRRVAATLGRCRPHHAQADWSGQRRRGSHVVLGGYLLAVAWLLLLLCPPDVSAADWSIAPGVSFQLGYDDNQVYEGDDGLEYVISPSFTATRKEERNSVAWSSTLRLLFYSSDAKLNRVDQSHALSWQYNLDERSDLSASASFQASNGFDVFGTYDGDYRTSGTRYSLNIPLGYTRLMTELDALSLGYAFASVMYDGQGDDYTSNSVTIGWTHSFSEIFSATLSTDGEVSTYEDGTQYSGSVNIGCGYRISERINADASVGIGYQHGWDGDDYVTGVGSISISYATQYATWSVSYSRSISPSSSGTNSIRDYLNAALVWKISERFSITGSADWSYNQSYGENSRDQHTFSVSPGIEYALSEEWYLTLGAQHSYVQQKDGSYDFRNKVVLGISWRGFYK